MCYGGLMEIWKPVIGFEDIYEVSNFGDIKSVKTGKIKKPTITKKDSRPFVALWKNNKAKIIRVHRVVLFAFNGAPKDGEEGCHNDGNPQNNNINNLRWDTASANQLDRIKHGTSNRGEQCASAKLTEKQVIAIFYDKRKQNVIASEYGILQNTVSRIKNGKRWSHLNLLPIV